MRFAIAISLVLVACAAARGQERFPKGELPNPFVFADGSQVKTREDWTRRREELIELFQRHEYGHLPRRPEKVRVVELVSRTDKATGAEHRQYKLMFDFGQGSDRTVSFVVDLAIPRRTTTAKPATRPATTSAAPPYPTIVRGDGCWGKVPLEIARSILSRGYCLAEFNRLEVAPDMPEGRDVLLYAAVPDGDFATLAAWAWAIHRCTDFLETLDFVDAKKLVVTGHSRGGKTALLAGALDSRFAIVNPNGSGCAGAVCFRFQSPKFESLARLNKRFPHWLKPSMREFEEKEETIPFDQHELKALVAPRALLATEALGDVSANPEGNVRTHRAAREVYRFFGAEEKIALHFRDGEHEHAAEDWNALLDFADHIFFKKLLPKDFGRDPFPELPASFTWKAPK